MSILPTSHPTPGFPGGVPLAADVRSCRFPGHRREIIAYGPVATPRQPSLRAATSAPASEAPIPEVRVAPGSENPRTPASPLADLAARFGDSQILIIDDDEAAGDILVRVLKRAGLTHVTRSTEASDGVCQFIHQPPDLVFLDLHMPGVDGFQMLDQLRALPTPAVAVPIIMLTGDGDVRNRRTALARGATDFLLKPFDPVEVILRSRGLLENRALQVELNADNALLEARVVERTAALEAAQLEMLQRLAVAAELHDDDTGMHTQRVANLAAQLAKALGLPRDVIEQIVLTAPLHDLGKIGIPDAIVQKPGTLTPEEMAVMRTHATIGARILSGGCSGPIQMAERIAASHHERWDGTGYPAGLAGEAIPLEARIVAVADVFDALTHARPYRPAVPVGETLQMIREGSGTHFEPRVAAAFLQLAANPAWDPTRGCIEHLPRAAAP